MGTATKNSTKRQSVKAQSSAAEVARDEAGALRGATAFQASLRRLLAQHEKAFGKLELEPGGYAVAGSIEFQGDVTMAQPSGGGAMAADVTPKDVLIALLCVPIIGDFTPTQRLEYALAFIRDARKGQATKAAQIDAAELAWKGLTALCESKGLTRQTPQRTGATGGTLAVSGSFSCDQNTMEIAIGSAG